MPMQSLSAWISVLMISSLAFGGTEFLKLYHNPDGMPLLDVIRNTKRTLDIEIYEMTDQDVRAAVRKQLGKARVRIIAEPKPLQNDCPIFTPVTNRDSRDCIDQKSLVTEVVAVGGEYIPFNKAQLCDPPKPLKPGEKPFEPCFEHGKMVLSDADSAERTALISTGNFNASNLCDKKENPKACNRDFTLQTADPEVIGTLTKVFEADLKQKPYDLSKVIKGTEDKLTVSPLSLSPLVKFIESAKHSVEIENQYLTDLKINEALVKVAKKIDATTGKPIQIKVMVSSLCYFNPPTDYQKQKATETFTQFDAAGIESRFFTKNMKVNGEYGYLHAKTIVVDGERAWVGSVNGSFMALSKNREFGLFFEQPQEVKKLLKQMHEDWNHPSAENWKESLNCRLDS